MVKLRKELLKNTINDAQTNLFVNCLRAFHPSVPEKGETPTREFARKKLLKFKEWDQHIEENRSLELGGVETIPPTKDQLPFLPYPTITARNIESKKEGLRSFLNEMREAREKNELIYGSKKGDGFKRFCIGSLDSSDNRKEYKLIEERGRTIGEKEKGWADFAITYDNKIFLNYPLELEKELPFPLSHLTMEYGTFLKAAGKLKIDTEGHLIVSSYSDYLELEPENLPIVLFVLKKQGILYDKLVFIADKDGNSVQYVDITGKRYHSSDLYKELPEFSLDEERFAYARTIAENEELSIKKRLAEFFLNIDDEILSNRNWSIIKALEAKRTELKIDIINFLLATLSVNLNNKEEKQKNNRDTQQKRHSQPDLGEQSENSAEKNTENKDIEQTLKQATNVVNVDEEKSKQATETKTENHEEAPYVLYDKLITTMLSIQNEHGIDLHFLHNELLVLFSYFYTLTFQAQEEVVDEKKELASKELEKIKTYLQATKGNPSTIPQRRILDQEHANASFVRFYTENPVNTCIALLRDYIKKGFISRFFAGAWNRHHVTAVEKFLKDYDAGCLGDNLSITDIYQDLFEVPNTLDQHSGKQGTLYLRLLFCATLANEMSDKTDQDDPLTPKTNEASSGNQSESTPGVTMPGSTKLAGPPSVGSSASGSQSFGKGERGRSPPLSVHFSPPRTQSPVLSMTTNAVIDENGTHSEHSSASFS